MRKAKGVPLLVSLLPRTLDLPYMTPSLRLNALCHLKITPPVSQPFNVSYVLLSLLSVSKSSIELTDSLPDTADRPQHPSLSRVKGRTNMFTPPQMSAEASWLRDQSPARSGSMTPNRSYGMLFAELHHQNKCS